MPKPLELDTSYLQFCSTDAERGLLETIIGNGSLRAASRVLDMPYTTAQKLIRGIRTRASKAGWAPEADLVTPVAPGMKLARHAQYYDAEGKPRGKWVIQTPDHVRQEAAMREAIEAMCQAIPVLPVIETRGPTDAELLNVYTFTDYHFNMLAWGEEAGADWDLTIAGTTLRRCFREMVDRSPPAAQCVIAQLGDFSHTDGYRNATPTSGHELDADSRYPKAVRAMLEALRDLVEYAAAKHDQVTVLLAEGNHDMSMSVLFREAFAMLYSGNPRIDVITDPLPYYCRQFGLNMLGWHHGHMAKKASLPLLFAHEFAPIWGLTKFRFIHTGHEHHRDVKEYAGAEVYQHPTVAASDAYAARGGWRAMRRAIGLTYHRAFGEWGSVTVSPAIHGARSLGAAPLGHVRDR